MTANPYVLLIVTGESPQVVTETVWSLARQEDPPWHPEAVYVVTTAAGAAHTRALLLGEETRDPRRGTPIESPANRWAPFCHEVLGQDEPVPLHIEVPTAGGQALRDIRTPAHDTAFADVCYELVAARTRPGEPPLFGSIAGGRKTMSAHLMTAFCVYARPQDRLSHVLVNPPALEGTPEFFYPTPETTDTARIDRVDLQFPRLRPLLRDDLITGLPDRRRDLRGILNALEPHLALSKTPTAFELHLRSGEARLRVAGEGDTLGTCRLSPAQAATLAVLAEALQGPADAVPFEHLYHGPRAEPPHPEQHPAHRQRQTIIELCERFPEVQPWTANEDVSKAVSRLNERLREVPIAAHYLAVESEVRREGSSYHWPRALPAPFQVTSLYPPDDWPFDSLPAPERPA